MPLVSDHREGGVSHDPGARRPACDGRSAAGRGVPECSVDRVPIGVRGPLAMNGNSFMCVEVLCVNIMFLIGCSFVLAAPAMAQDPAITVLASGMEAPVDASGQSISVIGADEIDAVQGPDLARVLERLPGVNLVRNGSLGGFTGLFVRGANSQSVLVLLDGARVADTAAPSGGYDFGNLMTGPIGKVELLRGSNGVVWGSDAIGGVLALTTRDVVGIEASAEYGARETLNGDVSGGFVDERGTLSLSAGYTQTDGFSSAASGTEADGFRQYRLSGRGRLYLTDSLWMLATGRYADSRSSFDGFDFSPPYGLIDTPEYTETREASGRAGLNYEHGALALEAAYSRYDISRDNFDPRFGNDPSFASDGRQERVEVKGRYTLATALHLDFGADHEWSRFETNFGDAAAAKLSSAHALLSWQGERLTLAAGARIDDHSRFGSKWTLGANGSYALGSGWRVRASYGEGFKAPTLFQLYSDFGNLGVAPERSKSYDLGVEKGDRNGAAASGGDGVQARHTRPHRFRLVLFGERSPVRRRALRVLRQPGQGARAGHRGGTGHARSPSSSALRPPTPTSKPRTARRMVSTTATRLPAGRATRLRWRWTGRRRSWVSRSARTFGWFRAVSTMQAISPGSKVMRSARLRASLPVTERIELFGRAENVTDTDYQTAAGYATAGRSAYLGARARF